MKLRIKKLHDEATIPTRGSPKAIGYDLYACVEDSTTVVFGDVTAIETGIAIAIPKGYYGRIAPRSGLAAKKGIHVLAGVIDADYRGEIKVLLTSTMKSGPPLQIKTGDRIAQLILERADTLVIEEVDDLEKTERGEGGFGSTGE
jgi:dUTP pyrophosphatase